ncbi:hypothetical protein [Nostoc sp.]|uniref:hypothetical protein n=1 Tax=Nostoc sp. TaxID=1180 RepID=UPI002FF5FA13
MQSTLFTELTVSEEANLSGGTNTITVGNGGAGGAGGTSTTNGGVVLGNDNDTGRINGGTTTGGRGGDGGNGGNGGLNNNRVRVGR